MVVSSAPTEFRPSGKTARNQRLAVLFCAAIIPLLAWAVAVDDGTARNQTGLILACFVGGLAWTLRDVDAIYGRLKIREDGIALVSRFRTREFPWSTIDTVDMTGWARAKESLATLGSIAGGALVAGALRVGVDGGEVETDPSAAIRDRLQRIGWPRAGVEPVIEIHGVNGKRLVRLKDTHSWDAAYELACAAAAAGCSIHIH